MLSLLLLTCSTWSTSVQGSMNESSEQGIMIQHRSMNHCLFLLIPFLNLIHRSDQEVLSDPSIAYSYFQTKHRIEWNDDGLVQSLTQYPPSIAFAFNQEKVRSSWWILPSLTRLIMIQSKLRPEINEGYDQAPRDHWPIAYSIPPCWKEFMMDWFVNCLGGQPNVDDNINNKQCTHPLF